MDCFSALAAPLVAADRGEQSEVLQEQGVRAEHPVIHRVFRDGVEA